MRFEKGHVPWNKGRKCPQISVALTGRKRKPFSADHKSKMSEARKGKTPWNTGKICPKISINQKGENNSFYGGKHTKEAKYKMSIRMSGENNPNYGKRGQVPWNARKKTGPLSEEHKRKISEGNKGKYVTKETRRKLSIANKGKRHSEESKRKMRKSRLNQVFPKKDTSIEVALQDELDSRGIFYEKHVPVSGVCQPDIVFPDKKTVIFADGNYWHSRGFKGGKVWERDRHQDEVLRKNGWAVLRFWGSEIREDVSRCVDEVEALLN